MPELGIASAQGLHFATLDGLSYPTDIEASKRWYVDDVIDPLIEIDEQGYIHLPETLVWVIAWCVKKWTGIQWRGPNLRID